MGASMTHLVGRVAVAANSLLGKMVEKTPVMGRVHVWTQGQATTSETARQVLVGVMVCSLGVILWVLYQSFSIIKAGKLDMVTGTFLGGVFTFFGGVLAITIPAFVSALGASNQPHLPPDVPPSSDPPTDP